MDNTTLLIIILVVFCCLVAAGMGAGAGDEIRLIASPLAHYVPHPASSSGR